MAHPNDGAASVSTRSPNLVGQQSSLPSKPSSPSTTRIAGPSSLNPLAYVPPQPVNSPRSRPSSRSRSKSPSPYPESQSSRPTTVLSSTDVTTPILPPIKGLAAGRSPSPLRAAAGQTAGDPPKISLPPISQLPNVGGHYVFGSSSGSTTLSSPPATTFAPSPKRSPAPSPLVFASSSYSTSHVVAGAGGAAYEAPRSPSFLLNANKPLPPPPSLPAAPPPVSPTNPPRSPGFMTQQAQLAKGKRRASPPSPINFSGPDHYQTQATLSPRSSMFGSNMPGTPTLGSRRGSGAVSPTPKSPAPRPYSGSGFGNGVGVSSSREAPSRAERGPENGAGESNGNNAARLSIAADPRMSLGNPLPWAHIVEAMTEERQEQEDAEAAEQAEGSIIVDSDEVGTDAGYESDTASSGSTSLASTVRDYAFENGRRYHKFREGRYNFPNDDVEQEREDMKHAMVKMLCQHLHFAPIGSNPQNMLDIGTGTGIWAIEMGDQYSSATVLGIDLSPIQPDWVPPNVRFMVDDVESAWLHPRNHFDYIHSRHTVMAIKDWPRLFRRALEHLKPGGWIELQEVHHKPFSADNSMPPDHPVAQYWDLINQGLTTLGVDFHAASGGKLANMMRDCGFVNVTERVFHVPIGIWPKNKVLKTVGLYWRTILLDGIQAIALGPLTRGCKWDREQVEVFLVNVRRAYHDNACHMYMPLHIVYGQKPENGAGWY